MSYTSSLPMEFQVWEKLIIKGFLCYRDSYAIGGILTSYQSANNKFGAHWPTNNRGDG